MDLTAQSNSLNHADRQTGADDIELTEEMLDAGESVLCEFSSGYDNERLGAEEVYLAMEKVRRKMKGEHI